MSRFTSSRQTGALAAFLAVFAFAFSAMAADTVANTADAYRSRLASAMQSINQHYEDMKTELQEEFQTITEEKDKTSDAIFEKVRALKAERQAALKNFSQQKAALDKTVATADVNAADKALITGSATMADETAQIRRAYDNSLETLQQLYTLNGRRYNELLKIHNAREALEENRYRELRDLAARNLRAEARVDGRALTDVEKREIAATKTLFEDEQKRAEDRYKTAVSALDEYKDLVDERIKAQTDYLSRYDTIMRELAKPNVSTADRTKYTEELAQLNRDKDAAERTYQNNARYIDEKLAGERLRGREMSRLADDRRELEAAWSKQDARYSEQHEQLTTRLGQANLSAEGKKALDDQVDALDQRYADAKKAHENAVENLEEREKLADRALDERMAYLKDRNDIRVRMAAQPVSEENFNTFRDDIAKLEEKRIASERDIRNQMAALDSAIPATFRGSRWERGNVEHRAARLMGRIDDMRKNVQAKWDDKSKEYNSTIQTLDQRLAAANLTDVERQQIMVEKDKAQKDLAAAKERFDNAIKAIDERRDTEQKRMTARAQYVAQRRQLRDNMSAANLNYDDMAKHEQQLAELDRKFADQERQYRDTSKPLTNLMPAEAVDANWRERVEAAWHRGVQRIKDEADSATHAVDRTAAVARDAANNAATQTSTAAQEAARRAASLAAATGAAVAPGAIGTPGYPPLPPEFADAQPTRATATANTPIAKAADKVVDNAQAATAAAVDATGKTATATTPHEGVYERDRAAGEGVWESLKDAIVTTYHDAVNYLTD